MIITKAVSRFARNLLDCISYIDELKNLDPPVRVCRVYPKCGQEYKGVPALSREDNVTLICPDCGTREALEFIGVSAEEQEKIISIIHSHYPEA